MVCLAWPWQAGARDADPSQEAWTPPTALLEQPAIDARPRDPLVARVELAACPQAVACDAEGALRFLLRVESDNADIQLRAMDAAQRRGDAAASERHWQAAVLSRRYDTRVLELGWALHEAYRGLPLPVPGQKVAAALESVHALGVVLDPQGVADPHAMNLFATQATPPFQGLLRRCRPPVTEARRDECMSLLGLIADDGTTLFAPMLALKTMAGLTAGTPEQAPWAERLRELKWQQHAVMPLISAWPSLPAATMADHMRTLLREGELAAYRTLLRAHGLACVPPPGWQPAR